MKPQPPADLLLRNQQWTVVEPEDWRIADGQCGDWDCREPAVAAELLNHHRVRGDEEPGPQWVRRCDQHLGTIRWRDGDAIKAWRADPTVDALPGEEVLGMSDERTDHLASVAQQLAGRVRDDEPSANGRWLACVLKDTTAEGYRDLCFVLAAAVPVDVPWRELTEWVRLREYGDGRPDTEEKVRQRQADLLEALDGRLTQRRAA